jgi:hypothetical protein
MVLWPPRNQKRRGLPGGDGSSDGYLISKGAAGVAQSPASSFFGIAEILIWMELRRSAPLALLHVPDLFPLEEPFPHLSGMYERTGEFDTLFE